MAPKSPVVRITACYHTAIRGCKCSRHLRNGKAVRIKIVLTLVMALACGAASALSLSIPKALIDKAVQAKFPREKLSIRLDNPVTKFVKDSQKIELCGNWVSKLPSKAGDFCIDFHPLWNKAKGDIEISKVHILKLSTSEGSEVPKAIEALLNSTVLTLLDGISAYHVPDMVGKHIEAIEVQESSFKLQF